MNLCGVVRSLVDMALNAVEAVAYAVFDFDEAADELWYRDDLVAKEAEEEVAEPDPDVWWPHSGPAADAMWSKIYSDLAKACQKKEDVELLTRSSSSPLVSAGGGEPAASAHSPSASQAAGNQLPLIPCPNCGWNFRVITSPE